MRHRARSIRWLPWALAAGLACACSSAPEVARADPVAALELADLQISQGEAESAYALLSAIDDDALANKELERKKLLLAGAQLGRGKAYKAYKVIRNFQDDHRFSQWSDQVEDLHFRIGETLIRSDVSYWVFGSDADDGEAVLVDFVTRFPTNRHVTDALQLLGELAFREKRWLIARERFRRIVSEYPSSEWVALARYRLAMAGYHALVGPEYDHVETRLTRNELRDYLATSPERPEFRLEAEQALARVEGWLATRHDTNARFYRRIGNRPGELFHLRALVRDYPDHDGSAAARERIAELEARELHAGAAGSDAGSTDGAEVPR